MFCLDNISLEIESGGRYTNQRCEHTQEVAIVVPYRNRSEHLTRFLAHLHPFLVKQNRVNYQIFVVNQDDNLPFNRGRLLNIGFREALLLNPLIECFIFHDVDIVPTDIRQLYTCSSSAPRHLCSYLDKFRYVLIYPNLFGGVISLRTSDFRVTNGYSNLYNGWGGEDDDFYKRVRKHFDYIERFDSNVGRCIMFSHKQYEPNAERTSLLETGEQRIAFDGLNNLRQCYRLKSIDRLSLYTNIRVKLTPCDQQQQ